MRRVVIGLAVLVVVAAGAFAAYAAQRGPAEGDVPAVRIGTGPEAEMRLVAHVMAELVRARDLPAEVVEFGQASDARQAVEVGDVDAIPAYTGATWIDVLGFADPPGDPETSYSRVKQVDERQHAVEWLPATEVNATFALVVRRAPGSFATVGNLRDLANHPALSAASDGDGDPTPTLSGTTAEAVARLCVDRSFVERPDGLPEVLRLYVFNPVVAEERILDVGPEDAVLGVINGDCVAGLTTVTDGLAWLQGLRPLDDPMRAFPAFVLAPVVREGLRDDRPEAVQALTAFGSSVNDELLASWNGRALGEPVEDVAAEVAAELLGRDEPSPGAG